ncbi:peptidoglycan-associated lipoprotein Pal [Sulfuriflexus mobilis]|uniref:peptidoglycan-associated lipoprotein Pal n=1 Tax=Sulfuriflexus mobilis TaxID=1811807 RepID=UPI000F820C8C|nr:peptidoglycan-associated lipoprotein Pal [Sulfuriflexus mobilis]
MKRLSKISVLLLPVMLFTGCESLGLQEGDDVAVEDRGTIAEGAEGAQAGAQARGAQADRDFQGHPLDDPNSLISQRVIYFDFDSTSIRQADRAVIQAHAEYLAGHGNASVSLEGHADERGSREYNIALGERRAKSVRQLLLFQGAATGQLETVSFGEERPLADGHDESAWQQNRRVEIQYKTR